MRILHLNLKGEYFDAIARGEKKEEYRLVNDYWTKRLVNREYDSILIKRGYPKHNDFMNCVSRLYLGYEIKTITHPHFGNEPVQVYAIKVN